MNHKTSGSVSPHFIKLDNTLQGQVLPIGGVKQKVLAAHRTGLTEVIIPKRNAPDLDDVPDRVRDEMTFHLADTYDDIADVAFT